MLVNEVRHFIFKNCCKWSRFRFFSLKKTVIVQWNDWKKTKRFAAAYEQIKIKNTWSK